MEKSCKQESLYYIHCSNNAPSKWERLESEQFSPCLSVVSLLVSFTGRKNKRRTENTLVWKMAAACMLHGLGKPCWMAYLKTICRAHIASQGWHSTELSAPVPAVPEHCWFAGSAGVDQYPKAMWGKRSLNCLPAVEALWHPAGLFLICPDS